MTDIAYRMANEDDVESLPVFIKGIVKYEKMSDEVETFQELGATADKRRFR